MKKVLFSLFLLFVGGIQLSRAELVTEQQARAHAAAFLHQNHQRRAFRAGTETIVNDEPVLAYSEPQGGFYVYNAADRATGFVLIAGTSLLDDPVLGYTDSGAFDFNNIPCNMKWWLEGYANYIKGLESGKYSVTEANAPRKASRTDVPHFLKSQWNQGAPYNGNCPSGCVTGCVATALAQVLYYYKQPTSTKATIPAWTDNNSHSFAAIPSGTTINWSAMTDTYNSSSSNTAKTAVASLMQMCGQAVKMQWGGSSNSTQVNAMAALHQYFGYSHYIRDIPYYSDVISQEQWNDMIYTEIAAKRPVIFSAGAEGGKGHVFLCEGYNNSDGKFYINWGWGGSDDGFFSLFALVGGSINWNLAHAVIGIQPDGGSNAPSYPLLEAARGIWYPMGGDYIGVVSSVNMTRSSSSSSFTSPENFYSWAALGSVYEEYGNFTFDVGLGIYKQDGTLLSIGGEKDSYDTFKGISSEGMYGVLRFDTPLTISSSIPNGTYYIYPICRKSGTSTWYRMVLSNVYNLQLVINGNNATVTNGSFTGHDGYESRGGSTPPETDTTAPTFTGGITTSDITASSVTLSWNKATDNVTAQSDILYVVESKRSSSSTWNAVKNAFDITSYVHNGLSENISYDFRVTAIDEAGNSTSQTVTATTTSSSDTTAPTFTGGITTSDITPSGVMLKWKKATDDVTADTDIEYFVDYRKSDASTWTVGKTWTKNITSCSVSGLEADTSYELRVSAKDEANNVTTQSVTITTLSSTAIDYGVTLAGTKLTSDLIAPGTGTTITNSYITGSVQAFVNAAGNEITIVLQDATIDTPASIESLLECRGLSGPLNVVLDLKGSNFFNSTNYNGISLSSTTLKMKGNGSLNIKSTWRDIYTTFNGVAEIGDEVTLTCEGNVGGNMTGTNGAGLIISDHAYVTIKKKVERLEIFTLNDNIKLLYPGATVAGLGIQRSSGTEYGWAVVKNFITGGSIATVGELYNGEMVFGETYNLAVASTIVNAYNAADILGNGQFSYDYASNELTLNNADLESGLGYNLDQNYLNSAVIDVWVERPLNINVVGDNTLKSEAGIPVLAAKADNPRVNFIGSGKLTCQTGTWSDNWGGVNGNIFSVANHIEFAEPEIQTVSGNSAILGTTSNASVGVSGGRVNLGAGWGAISTDPDVEPDGPVMIQNISELTLTNNRAIIFPTGGYFSPALKSITKNGENAYKGSILIDDEAVGIAAVKNSTWAADHYYTLDGCSVNGVPTKKGIYIVNGKKVVIK